MLYRADGTQVPVTPANGKNFTCQELYKIIGCDTVEIIECGDPAMTMIGDEEARCKNDYVVNTKATRIYREGNGIPENVRQHKKEVTESYKAMYGDMFIDCSCEDDDEEPYTIVGNVVYCPTVMFN